MLKLPLKPREVYEHLRATFPRDANGQYGHALGTLRVIVDWEENHDQVPDEIYGDTRQRIQRWINLNFLPKNTFDLLGSEEEPKEWRE